MRVRTPWIEALRKQREEGSDPTEISSTPATPPNRDLTPKKMSDSFHRVVRTIFHTGDPDWLTDSDQVIPLAQDPWLLDNYLNANGQIRCALTGVGNDSFMLR